MPLNNRFNLLAEPETVKYMEAHPEAVEVEIRSPALTDTVVCIFLDESGICLEMLFFPKRGPSSQQRLADLSIELLSPDTFREELITRSSPSFVSSPYIPLQVSTIMVPTEDGDI